ncbi:hypothetical protein A2641_00650 [Candidatus Nomurabacteria bacterium RIFCSPHIGHO2_01_FULL_37_25]|uniref:Hydrogenase n=1 Tax=Candidatus Nomurabacteria bacterium RIFCSPLOWO2_01_FULL_36_16 TaxID=1801767 RepID=A0A1F6WYE4_9BACT|nr:MAG: hypothetical protein A2641_00650 [Candidatus Nomurabacteria bacterium RIFCSPHIGHO2_01_FULL_37_25]OGI75418.1 MAG: hypothetical protein A3D36_01665 [Candidatus Nomurabacteria bacterium RIFCSPHIGHO2_02_FULL_36_29]OGI86917.1 MAG: hypothetical protein A3A91_00850 [Candidatus Nomurabacteria bacterium RIFCSPLOWO2_01_FULL_36_16]OGI96815.1 MAG: hypothetical protein A3I84_00935 [Candidatus Nomurabacteria bacterium RIFCSPLOWO2_02_FULL_36_8]
MSILILQFVLEIIFLTLVFLHISKKNSEVVWAYIIQSLALAIILFNSYLDTGGILLLVVVLLILLVKVILAPLFFNRLIKKNSLAFSVSTYLNMPFTLIIISFLTFIAYSNKFTPLTNIIPSNHMLLSLSLSVMFLSLFLIINRKGALSQIIGVLSFENSLITFIIFAGLEQSAGLQIGIIFDIFVWIIIATVFATMIYKQFGSLNVTTMNNLKD